VLASQAGIWICIHYCGLCLLAAHQVLPGATLLRVCHHSEQYSFFRERRFMKAANVVGEALDTFFQLLSSNTQQLSHNCAELCHSPAALPDWGGGTH
jgi:hypothetical protein